MKKGRAVYENDRQIRLSDSDPSIYMEGNLMENRIYFNAREWKLNPECLTNKGERSFISGIGGEIAEAFTIGSWGPDGEPTEIISKQLILEKNTAYSFTFWLNGGENDRICDEVCQLHIIYNNDTENALIYKLNRDYIKPVKKHRGWLLFELPFTTEDNEYTQLKFVSCNAYTTIMNAKDKSEYADLEIILDEYEGQRPLRHNIIWGDDGFDPSMWYSTKSLKDKNSFKQIEKSINSQINYMTDQVKQKYENIKSSIKKDVKYYDHRKVQPDCEDETDTDTDIERDLDELKEKILEKLDIEKIIKDIINENTDDNMDISPDDHSENL